MTAIAIVGAGRGLGAAIARKFGTEGYDVALISRNQERVDALAADLHAEGVKARGYTANVRDPQSLSSALDRASQDLGPIEVLEYSPLPQKEFLRPVLETTVEDLAGALEFSIYGPVAAVHQVLQGCGSSVAEQSCSSTAAAARNPTRTSRALRSRSQARARSRR